MNDTRTRLIETAARLLQQRGYHGMSLGDLLKEAGAPKGSLYFHFPLGKDQLVIEATTLTVGAITAQLETALESSESPAHAVQLFFSAVAEALVASDFAFGSPVAPLVLDGIEAIEDIHTLCRGTFSMWVALLESHFTGAGIAPDRARPLALLIQSSLDGLLLMARTERSTADLDAVLPELVQLVALATPTRRRLAR